MGSNFLLYFSGAKIAIDFLIYFSNPPPGANLSTSKDNGRDTISRVWKALNNSLDTIAINLQGFSCLSRQILGISTNRHPISSRPILPAIKLPQGIG
jgi:hypothetical protein